MGWWERSFGGNIIKYYYFFFTIHATVQFYVWNCTVAVLQKNLQYCCLQFSNAIVLGAANAKWPLHLALAFPNANALIGKTKVNSPT